MSTDTVSPDPAIAEALGRAEVYADLACGFAHPTAGSLEWLTRGRTEASGPLARGLAQARAAARAAGLEPLQRSYMRVFDPRKAPFPFEAEHRPDFANQQPRLLSDLMGFYRAFAVTTDHHRPDHICCQLEFVHVLSLKQARALGQGKWEQADICADARRKFLGEHLQSWYPAVIEMVRNRAHPEADRFYLELVHCLDILMEEEREPAA